MSLLRGAWCELVLRANNKASIERNVHLAEARGSTAGDLRNAELAELGLELGELLEERLARAGAEFVCLDCGRPPKNRKKGHVASGVSARRSNWEGGVDGGAGRAARGVPDMVVTAAGSKGKRRRSRVPRPQELSPPPRRLCCLPLFARVGYENPTRAPVSVLRFRGYACPGFTVLLSSCTLLAVGASRFWLGCIGLAA